MSIWVGFILHAELEYSLIFISGTIGKIMFFLHLPYKHSSPKFLQWSDHLSVTAHYGFYCDFPTHSTQLYSSAHQEQNTSWYHKKMNGVKELLKQIVIGVGWIISSPRCFHWKLALYQHLPQYPDDSFR